MTHGSVGLVKALSSDLKEKNALLAIFRKSAVFSFEGCVGLRVLAGLVEIEGHVIKPSDAYQELFSPEVDRLMIVTSLDPVQTKDAEFKQYVEPFQCCPTLFYSTREVGGGTRGRFRRRVGIDVTEEDIRQLNTIVRVRGWGNDVAAVGVLEELKGCLVQVLDHAVNIPRRVLTSSSGNVLPNFKPVGPSECKNRGLFVPMQFRKMAWDIVLNGHNNPVVIICGQQDTGKSTLCRVIVNYMLNRLSEVCYLDCDVGQPEFTVPGVVSFHKLTSHYHGSPFTHQRVPERSYYFGDISPKHHPNYYISLIQECISYYRYSVLSDSTKPHPLIVNTCGWVSDIGRPVFLDVVRTIKPTHVIQLMHTGNVSQHEIPILNHTILSSAPGWCLQAQDPTPPQQLVRDVALFSEVVTGRLKAVPRPSSPVLISSEGEDMCGGEGEFRVISLISSESENEEEEEVDNTEKERKPSNNKDEEGEPQCKKHCTGEEMEEEQPWLAESGCTVCRVVLQSLGIRTRSKNSRQERHLRYLVYFSPLIDSLPSVSSKTRKNFILASNPYKIPWNKVAIHSLHRPVPASQLLYALNGMIVGLGRVDEDELVDYSDMFPGMVKFIKSPQPVVEFIGLGLLRAIDTERKQFFITTPESPARLSAVNCLLGGNSIHPHGLVSQEHISVHCPYILPHFTHTTTGTFGYQQQY